MGRPLLRLQGGAVIAGSGGLALALLAPPRPVDSASRPCGAAKLDPDGSYRFARGEEVEVSGQRFRLKRPLDWAAVTDHAEFIGDMETVLQPGSLGHNLPLVKELRSLSNMAEREK